MCLLWKLNGEQGSLDSFFFSIVKALNSCLSLYPPSLMCLRDCACYTVCVCIGWVCRAIIGLKLCGMKFIKVSGPLWWKLCEGISTMTIARVHAKWLVFSCFLMKILPSYFGSQGLTIALTFTVVAGLRELDSSKSCLACREFDQASIYLLCPWRQILHIQFVFVPSSFHLETDWLSASPSTIITK